MSDLASSRSATAAASPPETGLSIGIGDLRPEKRGPFGTFRVTQWAEAA